MQNVWVCPTKFSMNGFDSNPTLDTSNINGILNSKHLNRNLHSSVWMKFKNFFALQKIVM